MGRGTLSELWKDTPFVWLRSALNLEEIAKLQRVGAMAGGAGRRLGTSPDVAAAVQPVTKAIEQSFSGYFPVRVVSFSKTENANWQVPWHQDRVIAVENKVELDGFSNWSKKSGHWHCEPPLAVLGNMLFVRVFLDDCDETKGGMEFAVGSQTNGLVPSARASDFAQKFPTEIETANAGDILVLPMLTLHRSRPTTQPSTRRTLRVDFARDSLPSPLQWNNLS